MYRPRGCTAKPVQAANGMCSKAVACHHMSPLPEHDMYVLNKLFYVFITVEHRTACVSLKHVLYMYLIVFICNTMQLYIEYLFRLFQLH